MRRQVQLNRRYSTTLGIALAVVVADLVTKRYASAHFADSPVEVIPGFLTFTFTENPGAAFSLFQNAGPFMGVAAIVVSVFVLWSIRTERPFLEVAALGLVLGGANGNLIDRVFRGEGFLDGKVIDWISMWWIPTFNISDASVTIAVGLLLIHAWRTR
ncbi:MAG: signal peptidase II [Acidobacteria bacterium]|nr:MAG: signal peptidase II [Acidobacteriota bacterium]